MFFLGGNLGGIYTDIPPPRRYAPAYRTANVGLLGCSEKSLLWPLNGQVLGLEGQRLGLEGLVFVNISEYLPIFVK